MGHRLSSLVLFSAGLLVAPAAHAVADDGPTGREIYMDRCAACHGPEGEGVEDAYSDPLVGDRSVRELAEIIEETMPEGEPEVCVGEGAVRVAAYIHEAFYSPIAQARRRPARIAFSRLTNRQYEHAVADLLASFTGSESWSEERGLDAEYFNDRRDRRDKLVIERRDPRVDFDFGTGSPDEEQIDPEAFAINWRGSIIAPETGDYEFIVETENGAKLWVNDEETPLIDAWVRSGDETEHRGSIRLLGGRMYPLRLEFFTFQEETASIRLRWKPPHHVDEVVPERALTPQRVPPTFVITTPFPPDDASEGYERGTSVSAAWEQATTYAGLEVARHVVSHLNQFAGTRDDDPERAGRVREFCVRFARRAFRRPLSDEERSLYVDRQFEEASSLEPAVTRSVLLILKSPRFLYHDYGLGPFDQHATAAWLSFALWDSIADQPLFAAAERHELQTPEQVRRQVERMIADRRTRAKLREFFHHWLKVDHFPEINKDPDEFPGFNDRIVSDLRTSLDLFLDDVVWSEASDFRQILSSDFVYLNGRLAAYYGVDLPADAPFQRVSLEHEPRAGVLTHPYLMAGFSYTEMTSPIHRGVFLARSVLGRSLKPPPEAVTPLPPELNPDLTTRERVVLQTRPAACQACHSMINPLGFALENFDAVGRFREEEQGRPVETQGKYLTPEGETIEFSGVEELSAFLINSEEAQDSFIEHLFQHMTKQPVQAFGPDALDRLRESFAENEFSVRRLLAEIATESAIAAGTKRRAN